MNLWSRMLADVNRDADSDLDSANAGDMAESDSVDEKAAPARETSEAKQAIGRAADENPDS